VGIAKTTSATAQGFDFGAGEDDAGGNLIAELVVAPGIFIDNHEGILAFSLAFLDIMKGWGGKKSCFQSGA